MENMKPKDANREELYKQLAIRTIRLYGIENTVRTIRSNFKHAPEFTIIPSQAIVRTMNFSKAMLRIAAVIIILISSATVYKYTSVNSLSMYNKQFTSYELRITRGETKRDLQAFTYQNENWLDVIAINNLAPVKTNKSRFLAGMAQLELKQYPAALELFKEVLANKTDDSFHEDAEYYSSLGFLADHQAKRALEMINQIRANPDHKYYFLVRNMSPLDLKIIEIKK
jgi:hypothetical protein